MSRIGLLPIPVPTGVDITANEGTVVVKGPKGELTQHIHPDMVLSREDGVLAVKRPNDERQFRQLHGLTRSLINNMVVGVTTGYRRDLEIYGVGYRAQMDGRTLVLSVGYSHPVRIEPPAGIDFVVDTPVRLAVTGIDKQLVGEVSAKLRGVRPPEPYKGKGIRYAGEQIRRKAGKSGKTGR
jgi:large subunit ribosomal protein L6